MHKPVTQFPAHDTTEGREAPAQGRATVDMQIKLKEARMEGVAGGQLKIVVDGYNAPVTGGNFVDLVQRGFYNNMEIQRADGFVVQTGDPGPPVRPAPSVVAGSAIHM